MATKKKSSTSRSSSKATGGAKGHKSVKQASPSRTRKAKQPKILITGISGRLGRLLTKHLHRVAEVHGVDTQAFDDRPKDVILHQVDLRKKRCENLFRTESYDAIYHLGIVTNPRQSAEIHHSFNVTGTMKILEYCHRYNVPKVVLLSSAMIYGPHPNNPIFLTEEAPLSAGTRFPQIRDLVELDMLGQSFFWKNSEIDTVILRPVHIVGPKVQNGFTNYLRMKRIPKLIGFDPMIQIVHEEDVIRALVLALKTGVKGIFNITGPSAAPLSILIKELRKSSLPLPHIGTKAILRRLYKLKITDIQAPELDYARFICTVDGSRAKEMMEYVPHYSLKETLQSLR